VQRQYTGTAGRTENAQVAVYLAYVAPAGHALVDRELYLPQSWIADPGRCRAAGIPEGTGFATKPALARRMLAPALDAGVPAAWVAGDEVYGTDPRLRADLEERGMGYVLAVACSHRSAARRLAADHMHGQYSRGAHEVTPRHASRGSVGLPGYKRRPVTVGPPRCRTPSRARCARFWERNGSGDPPPPAVKRGQTP
jgi:hypothetical protein